jgi:hypothetical protein
VFFGSRHDALRLSTVDVLIVGGRPGRAVGGAALAQVQKERAASRSRSRAREGTRSRAAIMLLWRRARSRRRCAILSPDFKREGRAARGRGQRGPRVLPDARSQASVSHYSAAASDHGNYIVSLNALGGGSTSHVEAEGVTCSPGFAGRTS